MKILKIVFLTLLLGLFSIGVKSETIRGGQKLALEKEKKVLYTNLAVGGGVIAYGFLNWDYGKKSFDSGSEGWFSKNTKEGGADKIGHFYTAYSASRTVYPLYLEWGYSKEEAIKQSFWTSFILTSVMEVGDGFSSEFGFSYEDFVSNSFGQILAYYLQTHPKIDEKVDFRIEYNFSNGLVSDPLTDYSSSKYLAALKLSGFNRFNDSFAKYLELHLGYYTRGYENIDISDDQRNLYVGVGINVAKVLYDMSYKKSSKIFNYYQVPYTYLESKRNFNR